MLQSTSSPQDEKVRALISLCASKNLQEALNYFKDNQVDLLHIVEYKDFPQDKPWLRYQTAAYHIIQTFNLTFVEKMFDNTKVIEWEYGKVHPYLIAWYFQKKPCSVQAKGGITPIIDYLQPTFKITDPKISGIINDHIKQSSGKCNITADYWLCIQTTHIASIYNNIGVTPLSFAKFPTRLKALLYSTQVIDNIMKYNDQAEIKRQIVEIKHCPDDILAKYQILCYNNPNGDYWKKCFGNWLNKNLSKKRKSLEKKYNHSKKRHKKSEGAPLKNKRRNASSTSLTVVSNEFDATSKDDVSSALFSYPSPYNESDDQILFLNALDIPEDWYERYFKYGMEAFISEPCNNGLNTANVNGINILNMEVLNNSKKGCNVLDK